MILHKSEEKEKRLQVKTFEVDSVMKIEKKVMKFKSLIFDISGTVTSFWINILKKDYMI